MWLLATPNCGAVTPILASTHREGRDFWASFKVGHELGAISEDSCPFVDKKINGTWA